MCDRNESDLDTGTELTRIRYLCSRNERNVVTNTELTCAIGMNVIWTYSVDNLIVKIVLCYMQITAPFTVVRRLDGTFQLVFGIYLLVATFLVVFFEETHVGQYFSLDNFNKDISVGIVLSL